jgi:hypothetical protein
MAKAIQLIEAGPKKMGTLQKGYPGASRLLETLGRLKDPRAIEGLAYWVTEEKWRVLRSDAAEALGHLGHKNGMAPLWEAWNQEVGYLQEGDTKGPSYQPGFHFPSGTVYSELAVIGRSLHRLGEKRVVRELIAVLNSIPETGSAIEGRGSFEIARALSDCTGYSATTREQWNKWWNQNKMQYE